MLKVVLSVILVIINYVVVAQSWGNSEFTLRVETKKYDDLCTKAISYINQNAKQVLRMSQRDRFTAEFVLDASKIAELDTFLGINSRVRRYDFETDEHSDDSRYYSREENLLEKIHLLNMELHKVETDTTISVANLKEMKWTINRQIANYNSQLLTLKESRLRDSFTTNLVYVRLEIRKYNSE